MLRLVAVSCVGAYVIAFVLVDLFVVLLMLRGCACGLHSVVCA